MHKIKSTIICCLVLMWTVLGDLALANERTTQTLRLANGLDALLISDPEVHRSAASLAVGTGMLYDPPEKQGLAHYLEHMLFLGTKKFPEVGSYKKYLDANSGASNAYTSSDITNYFFQVSHAGFEGALDRFSDFFKAPLFDEKYAEREVNAVSSEHDKNKRSDGWRAGRVTKLTARAGHPMRNFGTGNKDTLSGDNGPALRAFFEKYYSARNMKLSLISSLSLSELEGLVKKYFSGIPDRPVVKPKVEPDYRVPLEGKFRLLKIKSIKDLRSLSVEFPTIRLNDHLESKPASILGSIIGYEGKGSLLSDLKKEGLALGLSAGGGNSHPDLNSFNIGVSLTPKGEKLYMTVLERIFAYIEMLKKRGFEEYTYQESSAMAKINFEWKNPDEGMGYVAGRTALMFDYKLEDVETLPYLYKKYDPAAYRSILDTLQPENALVVLQSNSVEVDQKEKYYGVEYSLVEIGGKEFDRLKSPKAVAELSYPEKNDFIPYNLKRIEDNPYKVWDDERAAVWFKFDNRFKQPKAVMSFRIETPLVYDSVKNLMTAKLYEAAVQEGLNESVYPIQMAGLSYSLSLNKKGFVFTIGGYSERLEDLLALVAKNLKEIKIDRQKFADIKEVMLRGLENRKMGQAYKRGGYYSTLLWVKKHFNEEEKMSALKEVRFQDIQSYAKSVYQRIFVTGAAHGNLTDEQVKRSVKLLLDELGGDPLPEAERYKVDIERMALGDQAVFSKQVLDNNNSISYGIQIGEESLELKAKTLMIESIVGGDFYTQMRTNQQLGYIVWSYQQKMEDLLFFKFVIQSATHDPFELKNRIEGWLEASAGLFDNLSDEEFEKHRDGLIVSLQKNGDSIGEVLAEYYHFITEEEADFQYKEKMVQEVKKLRKDEVARLAKKIFLNKLVPRLAVLIRSNSYDKELSGDVLSSVEDFKSRYAR